MYVRSLDLRLLSVFDAIMQKQSVTIAGESLGLSQPIMSQSLNRLREYFGDPLFVRTNEGMLPTPRAQVLAHNVADVLAIVTEHFDQPRRFDPATTARTFNFFATDFAASVLIPDLMAHFMTISPNLRVRALPMPTRGMDDALENGEVDLAVGSLSGFGPRFYQVRAYHTDYVCVARKDHPQVCGSLSSEQFQAASHAVISPLPPGYEGLEKYLRDNLDPARIVVCLPNFLTAITFLPRSDVLLTIPRRAGKMVASIIDAQVLELPVDVPGFDIKLFWHERFHQDVANQWFRNQVRDLLQGA